MNVHSQIFFEKDSLFSCCSSWTTSRLCKLHAISSNAIFIRVVCERMEKLISHARAGDDFAFLIRNLLLVEFVRVLSSRHPAVLRSHRHSAAPRGRTGFDLRVYLATDRSTPTLIYVYETSERYALAR